MQRLTTETNGTVQQIQASVKTKKGQVRLLFACLQSLPWVWCMHDATIPDSERLCWHKYHPKRDACHPCRSDCACECQI